MNGQEQQTVKIFVRKGHDAEYRRLSFLIPPAMRQMDLLDNGFAIDGNQAIISVPIAGDDLLRVQRALVDSLERHGCRVEFA